MKAPEKIYLQTCGDCPGFECESCQFQDLADVSWCEDKIFDTDKEYIRKDVVDETIKTAEEHAYFAGQEKFREKLIEWLNGKMTIEGATEGIVGGYDMALKDVVDKLNSM